MLGIIVIIAISWLLLHLIEKRSILALGLTPVLTRLKQFSIGFLITAILCVMVQYLEALLKSADWVLNTDVTSGIVLQSAWWDLKSVVTEELIFRGAILYILIQRIGPLWSIALSAVAFGIYHWFSYGVLGNPMAMILVFVGTGLMGFAWAWAFSKTKSIMLPLGFHLGWNLVHNAVFSKGPLGTVLLISVGGHELTSWTSLLNFTAGLVIVPIVVLVFVKYFVKEQEVWRSNMYLETGN